MATRNSDLARLGSDLRHLERARRAAEAADRADRAWATARRQGHQPEKVRQLEEEAVLAIAEHLAHSPGRAATVHEADLKAASAVYRADQQAGRAPFSDRDQALTVYWESLRDQRVTPREVAALRLTQYAADLKAADLEAGAPNAGNVPAAAVPGRAETVRAMQHVRTALRTVRAWSENERRMVDQGHLDARVSPPDMRPGGIFSTLGRWGIHKAVLAASLLDDAQQYGMATAARARTRGNSGQDPSPAPAVARHKDPGLAREL